MARPPASLPPTSNDPLKVSLYLGSFVHDPVQYELFDLIVPPSQTPAQHPDEASFHPLPEIVHTFRPEQKVPLPFISAVFTLLLSVPWIVLMALVRLCYPSRSVLPEIRSMGQARCTRLALLVRSTRPPTQTRFPIPESIPYSQSI